MVQILKWFAGVILLIIFAYFIVLGIRAITSSADDVTETETATSTSDQVVNFFKSLFRPVALTSGTVIVANQGNVGTAQGESRNPIADKLLSYYKDWNVSIANGPDDFDARWGGSGIVANATSTNAQNNSQNNNQNVANTQYPREYIKINLSPNSILKTNQVLTGKAHKSVFEDNLFYMTVLDENKRVLGVNKMFTNGSESVDGVIAFRGVLNFNSTQSRSGYLQVKEDKINLIKIYFDRVSALNLEKTLQSPNSQKSCVVGGCSMQFCLEQNEVAKLVSTCEYIQAYQCYRTAKCERDTNTGRCGWRMDNTLASCLQNNF
jgi:hypothetical protein